MAIYEKGLKTPSGFMVGIPFTDVVKKYGKVRPVKFKGEGVESDLQDCRDYTYFCEDQQIVFLVDKKAWPAVSGSKNWMKKNCIKF